jgi:hypothetical protein
MPDEKKDKKPIHQAVAELKTAEIMAILKGLLYVEAKYILDRAASQVEKRAIVS